MSTKAKIFLGFIGLLIIGYFVMRASVVFFQAKSFFIGLSWGLVIGIIPYIRYRWFRRKKKPTDDQSL